MADATAEMVETFVARKVVNLGWCKRADGDFVHEYTDPEVISPRVLERLQRQGYVERRTVPVAELNAWRENWERFHAPMDDEASEAVEGESSLEETPEIVEEEAPVNPATEESIDDLGPTEEETTTKAPVKKVVRNRGSRRRSNG